MTNSRINQLLFAAAMTARPTPYPWTPPCAQRDIKRRPATTVSHMPIKFMGAVDEEEATILTTVQPGAGKSLFP